MEAYKIVNKNMQSIFATGDGLTQYYIGEKVYPPEQCGPLAAFIKLKYAMDFMHNHPQVWGQIFKCEVQPSNIRYLLSEVGVLPSHQLPPGTILCDWIELGNIVWP